MINPIPIYDIRNSEIITYVGIASSCIPHTNVIVGAGVLVGMGLGAFTYITSLDHYSDITMEGLFKATVGGGVQRSYQLLQSVWHIHFQVFRRNG